MNGINNAPSATALSAETVVDWLKEQGFPATSEKCAEHIAGEVAKIIAGLLNRINPYIHDGWDEIFVRLCRAQLTGVLSVWIPDIHRVTDKTE